MRLLPLMAIFALASAGCSSGAGMQATPPAAITQTGGASESGGSAPGAPTTGDAPTPDDSDADVQAPISQSYEEQPIPTGAGGRFLLD